MWRWVERGLGGRVNPLRLLGTRFHPIDPSVIDIRIQLTFAFDSTHYSGGTASPSNPLPKLPFPDPAAVFLYRRGRRSLTRLPGIFNAAAVHFRTIRPASISRIFPVNIEKEVSQ